MKTQILTHSDEVSGITILGDGTKCYWTDGCSDLLVVRMLEPWNKDGNHPIVIECNRLEEEGADIHREMDKEEEEEFDLIYTWRWVCIREERKLNEN